MKWRKEKFIGPSPGKKGLPQGKKIWRGYCKEKINSFLNFPLPPLKSLMVDPLLKMLFPTGPKGLENKFKPFKPFSNFVNKV